MEFYPNIISGGFWVISIVLCVVGLIKLLSKKRKMKLKWVLIFLVLIPIFDLIFGITNIIRDNIKGQIVFFAIDDSFLTTESIIIRRKNNELISSMEFSAVGFSDIKNVDVKMVNDSILIFNWIENNRIFEWTIDLQNKILSSKINNKTFRILTNKLIE